MQSFSSYVRYKNVIIYCNIQYQHCNKDLRCEHCQHWQCVTWIQVSFLSAEVLWLSAIYGSMCVMMYVFSPFLFLLLCVYEPYY